MFYKIFTNKFIIAFVLLSIFFIVNTFLFSNDRFNHCPENWLLPWLLLVHTVLQIALWQDLSKIFCHFFVHACSYLNVLMKWKVTKGWVITYINRRVYCKSTDKISITYIKRMCEKRKKVTQVAPQYTLHISRVTNKLRRVFGKKDIGVRYNAVKKIQRVLRLHCGKTYIAQTGCNMECRVESHRIGVKLTHVKPNTLQSEKAAIGTTTMWKYFNSWKGG